MIAVGGTVDLKPAPGWPGWVETETTGLLVALDDDDELLVIDARTHAGVLGPLKPRPFLEVAVLAAELYRQRLTPARR